jgi:hypothetical protein
MPKLPKRIDKRCVNCLAFFDYREAVIGIGLLCPRCVRNALPDLATLFQAMLDHGPDESWATAGDRVDAFDKMVNDLATAAALNAVWIADYLGVRGDLYKHTGPQPQQADYVGSMLRLWLDIPHVDRSLETVLAYEHDALFKERLVLATGNRVKQAHGPLAGTVAQSTIDHRWALVYWSNDKRTWMPTSTLQLDEATPARCAHALRVIRDRILELPHHEEGYQFHSIPADQARQVFNPEPPGLTLAQWSNLYNTLVRSDIVQDTCDDTLVDLEQLVDLAQSYAELHRQKLLAPLPTPEKCVSALESFSRRVGEHASLPEGTEWRSRVPIPLEKEGLVLATPEVIVTVEEWTAILHLIDDRGIWVSVAGQGFEVDRDELYKLIEEFATSEGGRRFVPWVAVEAFLATVEEFVQVCQLDESCEMSVCQARRKLKATRRELGTCGVTAEDGCPWFRDPDPQPCYCAHPAVDGPPPCGVVGECPVAGGGMIVTFEEQE